jgi:hypothetical protein
MTHPEHLDRMIAEKQRGAVIVPETAEERLAFDLIELAESFELDTEFDAAFFEQFEKTPMMAVEVSETSVKPNLVFRALVTSAAAIVVLTIAVFTIPPLHALAQQIIDFFIHSDTDKITVELRVGGPPQSSSGNPNLLSLEELADLVSFELSLLTVTPPAYAFYGASYDPDAQSVSLNYRCSDYWALNVVQTKLPQSEVVDLLSREVGVDADIEQVMIGAATGQYVRGSWVIWVDYDTVQQAEEVEATVTVDAKGTWVNSDHWQQIIWYDDGVLYTVEGGSSSHTGITKNHLMCSLDKDDFIAIAHGLHAQGSG